MSFPKISSWLTWLLFYDSFKWKPWNSSVHHGVLVVRLSSKRHSNHKMIMNVMRWCHNTSRPWVLNQMFYRTKTSQAQKSLLLYIPYGRSGEYTALFVRLFSSHCSFEEESIWGFPSIWISQIAFERSFLNVGDRVWYPRLDHKWRKH